MARYIYGVALDKFNISKGCDPLQVQSMYFEMNDRESASIPSHFATIDLKSLLSLPVQILDVPLVRDTYMYLAGDLKVKSSTIQ